MFTLCYRVLKALLGISSFVKSSFYKLDFGTHEFSLGLRKKNIMHQSGSPSVFYAVTSRKVSVAVSRTRMLIARKAEY